MDYINKYNELFKQRKELRIQRQYASIELDKKFNQLESEEDYNLIKLQNELVDEFCKKLNIKVYNRESDFQLFFQADNEDIAMKFFNNIEETFICHNDCGERKIFRIDIRDDYRDFDNVRINVVEYKEVDFKYIYFGLLKPGLGHTEIEDLAYAEYKSSGC